MHFEQSAILTVHNHVITRNPRISVTHDKHDKHRTWFLHINNVQEEDMGRYMCQINTVTAKTQYGFVKVVGKWRRVTLSESASVCVCVFAQFVGTSDIEIFVLACAPKITWGRDHRENLDTCPLHISFHLPNKLLPGISWLEAPMFKPADCKVNKHTIKFLKHTHTKHFIKANKHLGGQTRLCLTACPCKYATKNCNWNAVTADSPKLTRALPRRSQHEAPKSCSV